MKIFVLFALALAALLVPAGAQDSNLPPQQPNSITSRNEALLASQNIVRASVGLRPLIWSAELAQHAQQWADKLAASGVPAHQPDCPYGENLYVSKGSPPGPQHVVDRWAAERKLFETDPNCGVPCGHYTQIVWRSTERVGCGAARAGEREFWVCYYDPRGNWRGEKPY